MLACQGKYGKLFLDSSHSHHRMGVAKQNRADLSGVPASCATTCRPKSKGCLSSLVMGCTRRDPSGRMARKYSLSPTTSCSWLREALPTAFDRAVRAKPCACAACWNACKSQASVWSVLQLHRQTIACSSKVSDWLMLWHHMLTAANHRPVYG